jgi:hypothetical protein
VFHARRAFCGLLMDVACVPTGAVGLDSTNRHKSLVSRLFLCARVDSNHHGPCGPQGPQPYQRPEYASAGVQIVCLWGFRDAWDASDELTWVRDGSRPGSLGSGESRFARSLPHPPCGDGAGAATDPAPGGAIHPKDGYIPASDSMFFVRVTSWHGFGAVLDRPPANVAEAIEAAGLGMERASAIQALRSSGTNRNGPPRPSRPTEGSLMCGIKPALAAS